MRIAKGNLLAKFVGKFWEENFGRKVFLPANISVSHPKTRIIRPVGDGAYCIPFNY